MDFFKPGSFTINKINPDGSLTEIDASTDFLTNPEGDTLSTCDCPPGMCLGDSDLIDSFPDFLTALLGEGPVDDGFDDDDFGFDDEEAEREIALEATAQLGRIVEGLTEVVAVHAGLLKQLVG